MIDRAGVVCRGRLIQPEDISFSYGKATIAPNQESEGWHDAIGRLEKSL